MTGRGRLDRPTVTAITLTPIVAANENRRAVCDLDGDKLSDPGDTLRYTSRSRHTERRSSGLLFPDTPDANTAWSTFGHRQHRIRHVRQHPGQTAVGVSIGTLVAGGTAG